MHNIKIKPVDRYKGDEVNRCLTNRGFSVIPIVTIDCDTHQKIVTGGYISNKNCTEESVRDILTKNNYDVTVVTM